MKRLFISLVTIGLSLSSFSQEIPNAQPLTKEYYLIKSKQLKATAWVFMGGGVVLSAVGLAIGSNRADEELVGMFWEGRHDGGFITGGVLILTGVATMLGSIPFFIASSGNKRKAIEATAFIKIENRPFVQQASLIKTSYPALGINILIK